MLGGPGSKQPGAGRACTRQSEETDPLTVKGVTVLGDSQGGTGSAGPLSLRHRRVVEWLLNQGATQTMVR